MHPRRPTSAFTPVQAIASFLPIPFLCGLLVALLLALTATRLAAQTASTVGSTATTTTITSSGSSGNYTLSAKVSAASALSKPAAAATSSAPSGTITFIDKSNGNIPVASATLAAGTSSSTFAVAQTLTGVSNPQGIVSADLNGDGFADLAVVGLDPAASVPVIAVYLNNGSGTLSTPTVYPLSATVTAIAVGNFGGGHGSVDLVAVDATTNGSATFFYGDGKGNYTVGAEVSIADTNGAVITGPSSAWIAVATTSGIAMLTQSSGTWSQTGTIPTSADPDAFALISAGLAVGYCTTQGSGSVSILTGTGANLSDANTFTVGGCVKGLAAGPFHAANTDDLIVASNTATANNNLTLFLDQGSGTYVQQDPFSAPYAELGGVVTGDFNGDGKTDFAVASGKNGAVSFFYGNGNGTFAAPVSVAAGAGADLLATGTFATGTSGIAVTNSTANSISVLEPGSSGSSNATSASVNIPGTGSHQIYASYSGDSTYAASQSSTVNLTAQLNATSLTVAANPTALAVGQQTALTATLTPYTGDTLSTNAQLVTFYDGTKSLGTAALTSGIATLNVNTLPTGTDSITASYPGDSNFAASTASAITVSVSAAATPVPSLSATSLTFSGTSVGASSAAQTVTLSNTGGAALTVSSIAASGDFAETNTCGTSVAAGANCVISVTFTPTTGGARTGSLTIIDNATGSPQTVALNGSGETVGVTAGSNSLSISGSGGTATDTITLASQSGFTGSVNLGCSVTYTGTGTAKNPPTCSLNPASAQVTNGGSVTSTLTVSTTGATAANTMPAFRNTGIALAGLLLIGLAPRRRKLAAWFCSLLLLAAIGGLIGCGGGSNSQQATPGNYSVAVTASSGTVTASTTITVTVQ